MTANPSFDVGAASCIVIRHADLMPQAWRNGGGITREIATHPPGAAVDDFEWRVSIADITKPGAFSTFPEVDRSLTVIEGDAMVLAETAHANGQHHLLHRWDTLRFAGETGITSALPTGPTRDFNLMWRRGAVTGQVDVLRLAADLRIAPGSAVFFAATGSHCLGAARLDAGDTLILRDIKTATPLTFEPIDADAVLICARITVTTATATVSTSSRPLPQTDRGVA
ncbi:HutD family protein [Robbsia sp. KACC 23696]|uniref:HutD/Ves family protein n=1 Tax=Robbsia sp. KACC 23696 TaxID=3149231 RepID=UPI00325B81EF